MAKDRTRQTAAKLHTAGPNMSGSDTRLDLLGPAASGSGPSRSKESDADLSWVERVDGGGYGEPNRDGQGSTKMCPLCCYGNVALPMAMSHVTVGIPHLFATPLSKGSVVCERSLL